MKIKTPSIFECNPCLAKHLFTVLLACFILVKPVISILTPLTKANHELCENLEKEESKEKEITEEDVAYFHIHLANTIFETNQTFLNFKYLRYLSEYNPDIHIPPPEKA